MSKAPPRRYAEGTEVSVERSRVELEKLLVQHGAEGFMNAYSSAGAMLVCDLHGLRLRWDIPMPREEDLRTAKKPRTKEAVRNALDAEWKRRWRALCLIVKAKLEVTSSGERSLEHEFMADVMLPDRSTVGMALAHQLKEAANSGNLPSLLQLGSGEGRPKARRKRT